MLKITLRTTVGTSPFSRANHFCTIACLNPTSATFPNWAWLSVKKVGVRYRLLEALDLLSFQNLTL